MCRVRQVVNDVMGANESSAMLKKFSGALFFIVLLLTGALFRSAVSLAAVETLKENHVKGGTMTDLTGQAVQVDQVESTTTLWDIPVLATNELAKMKVFIADLTNLAEVGSWVEMTMKISGVYKADANKAQSIDNRRYISIPPCFQCLTIKTVTEKGTRLHRRHIDVSERTPTNRPPSPPPTTC